MARVVSVCPVCPGMHLGNERHRIFDRPVVEDAAAGVMCLLLWLPDRMGVTCCLFQILARPAELSYLNILLSFINLAGCVDRVQFLQR